MEASLWEAGRFENVLDTVLDVLERNELAHCARLSVPHHPGRRELNLFGLSDASAHGAERALRDIEELEVVCSVSVGRGEKTGIRLSDSCVDSLGEMLEAGVGDAVRTSDLNAGEQLSVDLLGLSPTIALDLGHLRSIALGNAVAAVLQACGGVVATQSQAADLDRNAGEAMAGYRREAGAGASGDQADTLARLNVSLLSAPYLMHGAVAVDDDVLGRSASTPWLIDDMLDEIVAHPEFTNLSLGGREREEPLAATVALGFFLGYPPAKQLAVSRDLFFDPKANAGWAMALASLRAWDERYDGPPDPLPSDRDYRFLIAQSQVHRQLARRSCEELNPIHLARFHAQLCRWFLSSSCTPRLARAMRTVSSAGIASLGLSSPCRQPCRSRLASGQTPIYSPA